MELINFKCHLRCCLKLVVLIILVSCGGDEKKDVNNESGNKTEKKVFDREKDNRLIIDSTETISRIENPQLTMLDYLKKNFTATSDSVLIYKPKWMIEENTSSKCGYILSFEEGHTFKHEQECNEWGEIVTVTFPETSASTVREIVRQLYKNEAYNWYSDSTEYRPKEYYETLWTFNVVEKGNGTELVFAYSWI